MFLCLLQNHLEKIFRMICMTGCRTCRMLLMMEEPPAVPVVFHKALTVMSEVTVIASPGSNVSEPICQQRNVLPRGAVKRHLGRVYSVPTSTETASMVPLPPFASKTMMAGTLAISVVLLLLAKTTVLMLKRSKQIRTRETNFRIVFIYSSLQDIRSKCQRKLLTREYNGCIRC